MKKHSPIVACVTMNYKNIMRFLPREAESVSVFFIEVSQHILNYSLPVNSKQHSYQVTVTRVFTGTEAYLRSSRSSHQRCFLKKHALKNFAIFTQKHLCWSFFLTKLLFNFIKRRHQHRCFPVNIAKFLRAPILHNVCEWLLLTFSNIYDSIFLKNQLTVNACSGKFSKISKKTSAMERLCLLLVTK